MTDKKYQGPDQRKDHRRKTTDRREDIRFELDNENRRKNRGRRTSDGDVWDKNEGE
jgi:hypothetical protein